MSNVTNALSLIAFATTSDIFTYCLIGLFVVLGVIMIAAIVVSAVKAKNAPAQKSEPAESAAVAEEEPVPEETAPAESAAEEAAPEQETAEEKQDGQSAAPEKVSYSDLEEVSVQETDSGTVVHAYDKQSKQYVVIRYNKSFTARVIQADDTVKQWYSEIKNELLSYKVKTRTSWRHEAFRVTREPIALLRFRGKALCLYLALDPKDYEGTKYKVEDASAKAVSEGTPCLFRIKNERRVKYAKDLIAALMAKYGAEKGEVPQVDYVSQYPYEGLDPLVEKKLVKVIVRRDEEKADAPAPAPAPAKIEVRKEVAATEVTQMMADDVAESNVEESSRVADRTKVQIVNIDALSRNFEDGEYVNLEKMIQRMPFISKNTTYVKVLANGVLDKALTVEADDFSLDAIKMILLTGGKVIRTKSK